MQLQALATEGGIGCICVHCSDHKIADLCKTLLKHLIHAIDFECLDKHSMLL